MVVDVRMPGMSGLELQEALRARGAQLPVMLITGHGDVAMAVRAMKAGAADFIEKPFNDQVLLDAVNRALAQSRADATRPGRTAARSRRAIATLTPREREVMLLVAEGRPNKVVATRLGLSTRTVEVHRAKVMEKMRRPLARRARAHGDCLRPDHDLSAAPRRRARRAAIQRVRCAACTSCSSGTNTFGEPQTTWPESR